MDTESPAYIVENEGFLDDDCSQELVPLKAWSDVSFLEWQHLCENQKTSVTSLEYVFQTHITNDVTLSVLRQALGENHDFKNWEKYKNGKVFKASEDAFKAILGTPNGSGSAWLLIGHKPQLGIKSISEVTVIGQKVEYSTTESEWVAAIVSKIDEDWKSLVNWDGK